MNCFCMTKNTIINGKIETVVIAMALPILPDPDSSMNELIATGIVNFSMLLVKISGVRIIICR
ncbi:hypothetical protein D3C84_990080 [compost metagenome]